MRADRLLSILLLLQLHGRMTASELAKRLEVSERTILRDMEALGASGVPVVAERGQGGGWSLMGDYETRLTGLTESERLSLFLPQPGTLLADLGLAESSKQAFLKLTASLPNSLRQDAQDVQQRILIDSTQWKSKGGGGADLKVLQEGIWQERMLHLFYKRTDGVEVERVMSPLGLVAKGSTWYLVGSVDGEMRTYRVSRIEKAVLLEERFSRPEGFDLVTYWEASAEQFRASLPRYPAVLRATEAMVRKMRTWKWANITRQVAPDEEGWVELGVDFETIWDASEYVVSLGAQVRVVEPEELRERVVQIAQEIVDFYQL